MLASLLPAALAARAEHADGNLPPVAIVVRRDGALGSAEPLTATLEPHPRLQVILRELGARRTKTGWALSASRADTALRAVGSAWQSTGRVARLDKTSTGLRLSVRIPHEWADTGTALKSVGERIPCTAIAAQRLVEHARKHHLPVFTTSSTADLQQLDEEAANTVVASCPPGMPGVVTLTGPADAVARMWAAAPGAAARGKAPTKDLARTLTGLRAPAGLRLLLRADAADALAVAAAPAPTASSGPPLHPWQAEFVGKYTATSYGMVNALPPGLGKSAAALGALRERHQRDEPIRALVLAPTSSRHQWLSEAATFFPQARVHDAGTGADLAAALLDTADGPVVVLTTLDLLAVAQDRADDEQEQWSDVVLDEATVLTQGASRRTATAWRARTHALRGMPLTGTPRPRRLADLEALVSFALGDPDLFVQQSLTAFDPLDGPDRVAAYVHTHQQAQAAPAAVHQCVNLPMTDLERILDTLVRARLADLAASRTPAGTALDTLLRAARLGYTDPAALVASSYALGRELRAAAPADAHDQPATKVQYVIEEVLRRAAAGEQVLVAGDSLAPLSEVGAALAAQLGPGTCASVTSKVAPRTRQRNMDAFATGGVRVLLLSGTAHLGLNLQSAAAVVHLDVPTTGALLTQRAARSARLGSTHSSIASVIPVLQDSVEDRLADLIGARGLRPADRDDDKAFAGRLLTPPLRAAAA